MPLIGFEMCNSIYNMIIMILVDRIYNVITYAVHYIAPYLGQVKRTISNSDRKIVSSDTTA